MTPDRKKRRRQELEQIYATGRFVPVRQDWLAFLSWEDAGVLQYLINVANMVKAEERNGGWFYCKISRFERDVYMSRDRQSKAIRRLKDKGLLKTEMRGQPAKRYIYIRYGRILKYIREFVPPSKEDGIG